MSRIPFIAGNWKLNLGPAAASTLAAELKTALAERGNVQVAVFPTALSIHAALPALAGSGIGVGVQEIESYCVNCEENGTTRLLLVRIPFFREARSIRHPSPLIAQATISIITFFHGAHRSGVATFVCCR